MPTRRLMTTAPQVPRPEYQEAAVAAVVEHFQQRLPRRSSKPRRQDMMLELPTGSGKTLVAVEAVRRLVKGRHLSPDRPVVWMAPRRPLLDQAVAAFVRQFTFSRPKHWQRGLAVHLRTVDLDYEFLAAFQRPPDEPGKALVHFVTLNGFRDGMRKGDRAVLELVRQAGLLVWDECHYAARAGAKTRRAVEDATGENRELRLLGLTATPVEANETLFPRSLFKRSFHDILALGYLARPRVESFATHQQWAAEVGTTGDYTAGSLGELARSTERNRIIVERWLDNSDRYRRTLVFACDKKHVVDLARRFKRRGVAVGVMYSGRRPASANSRDLAAFRGGKLEVLVNCDMLAEGVDIPDIEAVFLCRPTYSRPKLHQMIGRGARTNQGQKDEFFLVDFVDLVDGDAKPKRFLPDNSGSQRGPSTRWRRPNGQPVLEFDNSLGGENLAPRAGLPEELEGLWVHNGQSFGVEMEVTVDGYEYRSDRIVRLLLELGSYLRHHLWDLSFEAGPDDSFDSWCIVEDSSVGLEIVSPVLRGVEGLTELARVCAALERFLDGRSDVRLNYAAGVHVHLGWEADARTLHALYSRWHELEPALATLVAPSRIAEFDASRGSYDLSRPNSYTRPITLVVPPDDFRDLVDADGYFDTEYDFDRYSDFRYGTLNLVNLHPDGKQTVEVRMHSGSVDAVKLGVWICLLQGVLWEVMQEPESAPRMPHKVRQTIEPSGDIVEYVARCFRFTDSLPLRRRLHVRRNEIANQWRFNPRLEPWLDFADHWSDPDTDSVAAAPPASIAQWVRDGLYLGTSVSELRTWTQDESFSKQDAIDWIAEDLEWGALELRAPSLKSVARALGVGVGGSKRDICRRIAAHALGRVDPDGAAWAGWLEAALDRWELVRAAQRAGAGISDRAYSRTALRYLCEEVEVVYALERMLKVHLQALADAGAIDDSGNKDQIINRLLFADSGQWKS